MADYAKQQPFRKHCPLCKNNVEYLDYKDTTTLRKFVTDRGKIKPRRTTGACRQHQSEIATAIKRARIMALMPFTLPSLSAREAREHRNR